MEPQKYGTRPCTRPYASALPACTPLLRYDPQAPCWLCITQGMYSITGAHTRFSEEQHLALRTTERRCFYSPRARQCQTGRSTLPLSGAASTPAAPSLRWPLWRSWCACASSRDAASCLLRSVFPPFGYLSCAPSHETKDTAQPRTNSVYPLSQIGRLRGLL